ncbi:MAG: transcriptional activator RfaH [Alphaproteobacteria bacterium]|nr:transcriptional activator RfaH [Alphaproteobacteria bacterium]MDE2493990.1 transcriptional activator RfaH [Alphaproteobacteria bacterium]
MDTAAPDNGGSRWYVVQTKPHAESRATFHLERQNYNVFCPLIRKTTRHARKLTPGFAPLFPGYLFLNFDISRERWRSVNGTFGVVRIVMQGDVPQPVPFGVVEILQERTTGGVINWVSTLETGQSVRISDGPFAGLMAKLEHLGERGRVHVLLDLLGRTVSVGLHCEALAPAV